MHPHTYLQSTKDCVSAADRRRQLASVLLTKVPSTTDATPHGCFAWLHGYEELVITIADKTLYIPESCRKGLVLVYTVNKTARDLLSLSVCSKYLNSTLRQFGFHLIREAACRLATGLPPRQWNTPTPFVLQFQEERTFERVVKFSKQSTSLLALHCASSHCTSARRNVNLHLGRKLQSRVAVAHVAATRVAACSARDSAILFCHQKVGRGGLARGVNSKWLALVNNHPGVWTPHADIHEVTRIQCPETVTSLSASQDGSLALATTDTGEVLMWKTHTGVLVQLDIPYGFQSAATWFYKSVPQLLLSSELIREPFHPEVFDIPNNARSAVVHLGMCGSIIRWSNEEHVVHTNAKPDESGSLVLVVTLLHGAGASVRLLNTKDDSYEMIEEDPSRSGGELVATALSPRGDTCAVFCTGGITSHCNIFHRLSDSGWCRSSTVILSSHHAGPWGMAPPLWSESSATHAAFTSCGSIITFFSPRLTSGPRFGSITMGAAGEGSEVDLVATGSEHLPREVLFGPGSMWVRTHRGVLVISSV